MFLDKSARPFNGEKAVFSTNYLEKTGYPCAKEYIGALILYHMQMLI